MSAGDYRLFRSENAKIGAWSLPPNSQKPAISGPFCECQGHFLWRWMLDWDGRIRTGG
jgi:hypothetical protein